MEKSGLDRGRNRGVAGWVRCKTCRMKPLPWRAFRLTYDQSCTESDYNLSVMQRIQGMTSWVMSHDYETVNTVTTSGYIFAWLAEACNT